MIVLDENIADAQRGLLRGWKIRARQVGHDVGRKGMQDSDILPFLRRLARPTFFTLDQGFYAREHCHPRYCIAWLDVGERDVAAFARRLLSHVSFSQARQRMGRVIRVSHVGLRSWVLSGRTETHHLWLSR